MEERRGRKKLAFIENKLVEEEEEKTILEKCINIVYIFNIFVIVVF